MKSNSNNYQVLDMKGNPVYSAIATHPGDVFKDEIEAYGFTLKEVAAKMEMRTHHVKELLDGKRNVTALVAMKIHAVLPKIDPEFWLRMQNGYDMTVLYNLLHPDNGKKKAAATSRKRPTKTLAHA